MIPSPFGSKRNVIPRWRSLKRTVESRELLMPAPRGAKLQYQAHSPEMLERLQRWRLAPNVIAASELVEIGLTEGREFEALSAAKALLAGNFSPTPMVRDQASRLLARAGKGEQPAEAAAVESIRERLHCWRLRTRHEPRDALAWVELARLQLASGEKRDAKTSMLIARQLAPTNRHVIRSATRMFLHLNDDDAAQEIVRRCERTKYDPWLTAAEIAVAAHRGKSPHLFKTGENFIEQGKIVPHQFTELAAAMGTVLLRDGNRKRGKKLMVLGLGDPTGNTLAQAEWVSVSFHETLTQPSTLKTSHDAHEARALRCYRVGLFTQALTSAVDWLEEEPFSGRAHMAAVAAACTLEDYPLVIKLADDGLKFDPGAIQILQNKIYALACSGKLDEAEGLLAKIEVHKDFMAHVGEANKGLIAMRRGNIEKGLGHYRAAIAGFRRDESGEAERAALTFLAREAVRAKAPKADAIVAEAEKKLGTNDDHHARKVLREAKLMQAAHQSSPASNKPVPAAVNHTATNLVFSGNVPKLK